MEKKGIYWYIHNSGTLVHTLVNVRRSHLCTSTLTLLLPDQTISIWFWCLFDQSCSNYNCVVVAVDVWVYVNLELQVQFCNVYFCFSAI